MTSSFAAGRCVVDGFAVSGYLCRERTGTGPINTAASIWRFRALVLILMLAFAGQHAGPSRPSLPVSELGVQSQRPTVHAVLPKAAAVVAVRTADERGGAGLGVDAPPALPAALQLGLRDEAAAPLAFPDISALSENDFAAFRQRAPPRRFPTRI